MNFILIVTTAFCFRTLMLMLLFSDASLTDGEEAPSVYIRPVCSSAVAAHQGQLSRDDWRNNLRPRTKDPGRFGKTDLVS